MNTRTIKTVRIANPAWAVLVVAMLLDARRSSAQTPGTIYACVQVASAQVRIVSAAEPCRRNEARVQWSSAGVTGPQGVPGPAGPQGPAGAAGPKGTTGDQGAAGVTGPMGPVGPAGVAGQAGPVGPEGPVGVAGAAGPKGATGDSGPAGVMGPVGPVGPAGPVGPTGAIGAPGDAGPMGPVGPAGAAGPTGPSGVAGAKGPTGDAGPIGATGPKGATGDAGPQGPVGPVGPQGLAVQGPQGPQGPVGAKGPAGTPLPAGSIAGTMACNGTPVPAGSVVYLEGRGFTAFTGTTGAFQFDHVPAGTYKLVAEVGGAVVMSMDGVGVGGGAVNLGSITTACAQQPPTGPCGVCPAPTPICDTSTRTCVQCLVDQHCIALNYETCMNFECYEPLFTPASRPSLRPGSAPSPLTPITPYSSAGSSSVPRH